MRHTYRWFIILYSCILLCWGTPLFAQYYDAPPPEPEPKFKYFVAAMTGYNTLSSPSASSFIGNSNSLTFGVRLGERHYLCAASYRELCTLPIPTLTSESYSNLTGVFALEYRNVVYNRIHLLTSVGAGSSGSDSSTVVRGQYIVSFIPKRTWIPYSSVGAAWTGDGKPFSFVIEGRLGALVNPYQIGSWVLIPSFRVGLYFSNH